MSPESVQDRCSADAGSAVVGGSSGMIRCTRPSGHDGPHEDRFLGQIWDAAVTSRVVRVDRISRYREILEQVVTAACDLRDAAVDHIVVDLSVDAPPDGVEFVLRQAAEHDDDYIAWSASTPVDTFRRLVRDAAIRLLPAAAKALGAVGTNETIYVRAVGGAWHVDHAATREGYRLLATEDGDTTAAAAQHGWALCGGPRDAYVLVVPATGESMGVQVDDWVLGSLSPHYERVHAFRALTLADSALELGDADPIVAAIHRAQTTGLRHASRVRAAKAALVQYVLDEDWTELDGIQAWVTAGGDTPPALQDWHVRIPVVAGRAQPWTADDGDRIVGALVAFDLHGVGGPGGFSGGSTATMSWRRGLGKGRRQATDGSAWDAAIEQAGGYGRLISPSDALLAVPHVRPIDLEWPMAYALDRAYEERDDAEESRAWCAVARAVMARAEEPSSPSLGPAIVLGSRYGVISTGELR